VQVLAFARPCVAAAARFGGRNEKSGFSRAVRRARQAAERRGRRLRIMFADEARFGRIMRPKVASQLIREYIYLYGAVAPMDGTCVYLIMPTSNTACFQAFLDVLSRTFAKQDILLVLDGAPNHRSGQLVVPKNITLLFLPPYSPELNPKENLWDEIREKIFKNYALKSIDHVRQKLNEAILYVERNPDLVKSITSFPYIAKSF
jgi:transposase